MIKLIPGWQKAYKFLSVQIGLIGATIFTLLTIFPDAILYAWNSVPLEFRNTIPPRLYTIIGVLLFALAVIARLIKQPKANAEVQKQAMLDRVQ